PEQSRGRAADASSDIYALGVMIHEMLTGTVPFDGPSLDVMLQHASDPPPPMSNVRAELPAALDAPVLAMLAKRPKDRPPSGGQPTPALVDRGVELGVGAAPPSTKPRSAPERAPRVSQRTTLAERVGPTLPDDGDPSGPETT